MKLSRAAGIAFCLLCVPAMQGCVGVAATGAAVGGVAAQDRRTPGSFLDDELIEHDVLSTVYGDERMASQVHINATSFNGFVLLTGEAPGDSLRTRVTEIARDTPSVRAVQNEIVLMAPSSLMARASDALVTARVKIALLQDEELDAAKVKVVTERGTVYLMGLLSQAEADRATEISRRVGGVQSVVKVIEYIE